MESKPTPVTETEPGLTAPVMDVVAAPPPESPTHTETAEHPPEAKTTKPAAAQKSTAHKKSNSGVGMAIFATVIIVIALAALATYAYLKQTNHL